MAFALGGLSEREVEQLIRLLRKLRLASGDFDETAATADDR